MNARLPPLLRGPTLVDGAWGTELQRRGLVAGACPDAWNLDEPARVAAVARAYVEAGSQVVLTNTFGANRLGLERHGRAGDVVAINRAGVELSREAAGDRAAVFASMGPTGKLLAIGQTTDAELRAVFAEQAAALAAAGADALLLETFTDLDELRPALAAAKATGLRVVASMVFDSGRGGDRTMMGTTPEQAAEAMAAAGADVIGANCGRGAASYVAICARMRRTVEHPLWMKPNAGLPVLEDGRAAYPTSPDEFAASVRELLAAGAAFVGGCCGTDPDYLRAAAEVVRDAPRSEP